MLRVIVSRQISLHHRSFHTFPTLLKLVDNKKYEKSIGQVNKKQVSIKADTKAYKSDKSDGSGNNGSHIFTSKTEHTQYSAFGGGFEHIEEVGKDDDIGESDWNSVLSNPRIIMKHLDEYVIGQEKAKKILSVAVFNHYSRVRANNVANQMQNQVRESGEESVGESKPKDTSFSNANLRVPLPISTPSSFQYHQLKRSWINPNSSGNTQDSTDSFKPEPAKTKSIEATESTYDKSNVLLLGPTGSGKTLLARTLANVLKVPFSMSDATPFTQAGYVGEDVELVIQRLLQNCDFDVKRAEQGIVFIDEIDKIARRPDSLSVSKDVSGEGVQQALLRMLEGTTVTITDKTGSGSNGRKGPSSVNGSGASSAKGDTYSVDTSNILFILSGAFIGLEKLVMGRLSKSSIGFDAPIRSDHDLDITTPANSATKQPDYLELTEPTDLIKYGLIPEFIGRLPVLASVASLDEEALVRVLTEPRNSLVKQYMGLFRLNKVDLHFSRASLKSIAQVAITKKTGARGLRRIMETTLLDPMFEVPGTSVKHVVVTRECISGIKKPYYLASTQIDKVSEMLDNDDQEPTSRDHTRQEQASAL